MRWGRVAVGGAVVSLAAGWAWLRQGPAPELQRPGDVAARGGPPAAAPPPAAPPPTARPPSPAPVEAPELTRAPQPLDAALDAGASGEAARVPAGAPGPADGGTAAEARSRMRHDLEAALRVVVPEVEACRSAWREADPSLAGLEVEFALVPGDDGGYALEPRFLGDAGLAQVALQGCMHNALEALPLERLSEGLQLGAAALGGPVRMRVWLRPPPPEARDAG